MKTRSHSGRAVMAGAVTLALACSYGALAEAPAPAATIANSPAAGTQVQRGVPQRVQKVDRAVASVKPATDAKRYVIEMGVRFAGAPAAATEDRAAIRREADRLNGLQERFSGALREAGLANIKPIRGSRYVAASGSQQQIDAIRRSGIAASVTPDFLMWPDTQFSIPAIKPPPEWNYFVKGRGQVVAIIDTGVLASHDMLDGALVSEACFSTTDASMGSTAVCQSGSTAAGSAAPCNLPKCDHGTFVTGIAVGRKLPNNAAGGVANEAGYVAIQAASEIGGTANFLFSDILASLYHVRDLSLADVRIAAVNLSLGGGNYPTACPTPINTVMAQLSTLNVASVVSSGNEGFPDAVGMPACSPAAITVAASDNQDQIHPNSNLAPMVDLLAPGVGIVSALSSGNSNYGARTGTSAAAPHVSGVYAALRQIYPCVPQARLDQVLRDTADPIAATGSSVTYGRINFGAAFRALGPNGRNRACLTAPAATQRAQPPRRVFQP